MILVQVNRQIDIWDRIARLINRLMYMGKMDTLQISGDKMDYSINGVVIIGYVENKTKLHP